MYPKPHHLYAQRLFLGPIRETDQEDMLRIFRNEDVCKTYMLPIFRCREDAVKLFSRFRELSQDENRVVFGIYLKDRLIGFLNDVTKEDDTIEMGYVIHPDYKNQGYCTEAFSVVIGTLFAMGYNTVNAGAFEGNIASIRVMEKCGMVPTNQNEDIDYRGQRLHCINYTISKNSDPCKMQPITRVTWMEHCFTMLQSTVEKTSGTCKEQWFQERLMILTSYYESGQWLADYELDEQGYFPSDMNRGVLSQDAVYNFLARLKEN